MKKEIEPYNLRLIDCIPVYGIYTHARRVGENSPPENGISLYTVKTVVSRAAILAAWNVSVLAGGLGLENMLSHST